MAGAVRADDPRVHGVADFCQTLGAALSDAWDEHALDSCLWVFVAGYEDGEPQFWYVVNATRQNEIAYSGISRRFRVVNDLDDNYLAEYRDRGLSKTQVLEQISFHFRNGAVFPGAFIFDAFSQTIEMMVSVDPAAFGLHPFTLVRYAYIARQRMEFLKRLYSPTHGICSPTAVPLIDGTVYVYTLAPDGTFTKNPKIRSQSRTV
jgi:hypothetical protein